MRNPSIESIEKLATALQISVATLFERAGKDGRSARSVVEILFVEDNPDDIELTLRAFEKARITNPVHVVRDGQEALDFIFASTDMGAGKASAQSLLILLDLNLPKVSGIDVLTRMKADKRTQNIPIIVLTASNHDRDIVTCRRLGCEEYMVKPVEFQNLSQVTSQFKLAWTLVTDPTSADDKDRRPA
jgi:two-component system response regulator